MAESRPIGKRGIHVFSGPTADVRHGPVKPVRPPGGGDRLREILRQFRAEVAANAQSDSQSQPQTPATGRRAGHKRT